MKQRCRGGERSHFDSKLEGRRCDPSRKDGSKSTVPPGRHIPSRGVMMQVLKRSSHEREGRCFPSFIEAALEGRYLWRKKKRRRLRESSTTCHNSTCVHLRIKMDSSLSLMRSRRSIF